jgi:hypothetical protein
MNGRSEGYSCTKKDQFGVYFNNPKKLPTYFMKVKKDLHLKNSYKEEVKVEI